ncbi:MAG: Cof-type HAD-IIB family hydrolase [Pauljensenia sp.]
MDLREELPENPDVRLVVADMDGTLLDGDGQIPEGLWPLLDRMEERGIVFAPASGRQYATLREMFARAARGMTFIAENGALVVRDGAEVSSTALDRETVEAAVQVVRTLAAQGSDVGLVLAGAGTAWLERTDERFLEQARPYYRSITAVPDLLEVPGAVLKVALLDFGEVAVSSRVAFGPFQESHQWVVSGERWSDLMARGVDKGAAVRALQDDLGISRSQTVAFGDFHNDLGMLAEAEMSFAVANAHPDVIEAARYLAPANTDDGVVGVLDALVG